MSAWCPRCGCVSIQWAGCDHDYHYSPVVVDAAIEHMYGGDVTKSRPAGASTPPARGENLIGGPHMKNVSTVVNPGPASDGA